MDNNLSYFLKKIKDSRIRIDDLDDQIVHLLNARAKLALNIGELKNKIDSNDAILHPDRESRIINRLKKVNTGPFPSQAISFVWSEIISACRSLEHCITVAYLGPKGSFSEQAAMEHFGHSIKSSSCLSLDEVFRLVETGLVDIGMIPIENSTEGPVNRSLDLLLNTPLKIMGERSLTICHCLMTKTGSMEGIKYISSHPQTLAQCQRWIKYNYPGFPVTAAASNSDAARSASENSDIAAIAGKVAALTWNLKVIADNIQDDINNRTRFVAIGNKEVLPSGNDKSSLILAVPNQSGAVCEMLIPFSKNKVSMTRLESRPARTGQWEYYFYIDIQGHQSDSNVAKALEELSSRVVFFKILGSYPAQ